MALVVLLLVVVLGALAGWWATRDAGGTGDGEDAAAARPPAPLGQAFYSAPDDVVRDGEHGSLIWSREETSASVPGATTHLVLYRSVGASGEPVAVSGTVTIPDRPAPAGGWPVLSWGHGTTGTADACAPSRGVLPGTANFYTGLMAQVYGDYVERGYAVVATDYEGLGTPGPHPYLMGESAGRAMTDIVSAARELDDGVSGTWLAAGHSQGGQAALFTAASVGEYGGDLDLAGIVALAPPSHLSDGLQGGLAEGGRSVFLGPILASAARVAGVAPEDVFSAKGVQRLPGLEEVCLDELSQPGQIGELSASQLIRGGADLAPLEEVVADNDASVLDPTVPVLVVHGTVDETVPVRLSDRLAKEYRGKDVDLTYERVPGRDHVGVLTDARGIVDDWVREDLPQLPG